MKIATVLSSRVLARKLKTVVWSKRSDDGVVNGTEAGFFGLS